MSFDLHVEQLVPNGLPFGGQQRPHRQAAVKREPTRLLTDGRLATPFNTNGELAYVEGGSIKRVRPANPAGLGEQIAATVCGGPGGRP